MATALFQAFFFFNIAINIVPWTSKYYYAVIFWYRYIPGKRSIKLYDVPVGQSCDDSPGDCFVSTWQLLAGGEVKREWKKRTVTPRRTKKKKISQKKKKKKPEGFTDVGGPAEYKANSGRQSNWDVEGGVRGAKQGGGGLKGKESNHLGNVYRI